jgi:hypothetical protein
MSPFFISKQCLFRFFGIYKGGNITTFGCLTRVYGLTILAPIVEKPSPIAQQLSGARF